MIKLPKRGCAPPLLAVISLVWVLAIIWFTCGGSIGANSINMVWEPDSTIVLDRNELAPVEFRIYNDNSLYAVAYDSLRIEVPGSPGKILITTIPDTTEPPPPPPSGPSRLADSAAVMVSGQWVQFVDSDGTLLGLLDSNCPSYSCSILDYNDEIIWVNGYGYILGQGHGGTLRFIRYDEVADQWTELAPPGITGLYHHYDQSTFANGILWSRWTGGSSSQDVLFSYENDQWGDIPYNPGSSSFGALEYFPGVGLVGVGYDVHVSTDWGLSWTSLGAYPASSNMSVEYVAGHDVVYIMGGETGGGTRLRTVYRVDRGLALIQLADAPTDIKTDISVLVENYLLADNVLREFDGTSWSVIDANPAVQPHKPGATTNHRIVGGMQHGVIVFVQVANFNTEADIWLYRP